MKWRLPFLNQQRVWPVAKITVDQRRCRGCIRCTRIAPSVFRINEEGKAEVIATAPAIRDELLDEAIGACSTLAIDRID